MKKIKLFLVAFIFTIIGLTNINAEGVEVKTEADLKKCLAAENGVCVLADNITTQKTEEAVMIDGNENLSHIVIDGKTAIIDLNGKILTTDIILNNKANLTIKDSGTNGKITYTGKTVKVINGSKLVLKSGVIDSGNQSVTLIAGNFIMDGGKLTSQEMGVAYFDKSILTINNGTIETKDNCAIGDNGTKGRGGNTVTINGGNLISNIVSKGYISCGIHNANDTTLIIKSGVKITANNGGAGIVVRGGKVTVANDVVASMITGETKGKVGDSSVLVTGKIVKDYASNYPAKDTINVTIDYNTVSDKKTINNIETKQQTILNNEINNIINNNIIESLKNVDLTDIAIKTVLTEVDADVKEKTIENAKKVLKNKIKDFTIAEALDLKVVVTNKDDEIYNVTETSNKIPFGIDVKSIATNSNLNYDFQIIRVHASVTGDEYTILDSAYDAETGIVSFESDKFSTYLISYKTSEKVANPNTNDNIIYSVIGFLLSIIVISGVIYKFKKQLK